MVIPIGFEVGIFIIDGRLSVLFCSTAAFHPVIETPIFWPFGGGYNIFIFFSVTNRCI